MDEGFPVGTRARGDATGREQDNYHHSTLNQWRARSAVDPPRTIPNRVVKHRSAEGTGGLTAGRDGPCAHHRGVEQWQLVGLITRRSMVRIHPPLPYETPEPKAQGFLLCLL
jgi:hypothetical protein